MPVQESLNKGQARLTSPFSCHRSFAFPSRSLLTLRIFPGFLTLEPPLSVFLGTGRAAGLVDNRLVRAVFAEAQHLTAFSGFRDVCALAFVPLLWCGPWFLRLLGGLALSGAGRFCLRRLASGGTGSGTLAVANLSDFALRLGLIGRVRRHRQLEFPLEGTAYYPLVGAVDEGLLSDVHACRYRGRSAGVSLF